ncbi:MAG TPA: hypothetical protein VFG86_04750 [Chloroflexota bacterium]|nr:hypothetical protein [Chloroflexota bacterium]
MTTTAVPLDDAAGADTETTPPLLSTLPAIALLFSAASASVCPWLPASATSARSELGAALTCPGATSSGTVATTLAMPIGTTVSVRSSWLAVTAYSPESGSGARKPPCPA